MPIPVPNQTGSHKNQRDRSASKTAANASPKPLRCTNSGACVATASAKTANRLRVLGSLCDMPRHSSYSLRSPMLQRGEAICEQD